MKTEQDNKITNSLSTKKETIVWGKKFILLLLNFLTCKLFNSEQNKTNPKVLFVGGGTGGHIYPLIPLVKEFEKHSYKTFWLTGYKKSDIKAIKEFNLETKIIRTFSGKIRPYFSWRNATDIFSLGFGFLKSLWVLITIRPQIIFLKGGYCGFPLVILLRILNIFKLGPKQVYLHESDITFGNLSRFGGPIFKHVFHNYSENPESLFYHGLKNTKPTYPRSVLVFGGSQGAAFLNEFTLELAQQMPDYNFTVVTGKDHLYLKAPSNVILIDYVQQQEMWQLMQRFDFCIHRGGASIFQIINLQIPNLVIPYPYSARNHHTENAQFFKEKGLCDFISETEVSVEKIAEIIHTELGKKLKENHFKSEEKAIFTAITQNLS